VKRRVLVVDVGGEKKWKRAVIYAVAQLKRSFIADCVVLGHGNVGRFDKLPKDVEPGKNENAFLAVYACGKPEGLRAN
jgi:hypothetical protein